MEDTHEPYVYPQENGAHEDTRYLAVADSRGAALVIAGDCFSFSAHDYTPEMLEAAAHDDEIVRSENVTLLIDGAMGGLGTASCGPAAAERFCLYLKEKRSFRFAILPCDLQTVSVAAAGRLCESRVKEGK